MLFHTDLPKIDNRMGGTPDHNKAIAQGFVAMYDSYPADNSGDNIGPNRRTPSSGLDRSQGLPRPARQAGARPAGR